MFIPTPENLLVNLREAKELAKDLLTQLPAIHKSEADTSTDTYSALGPALEVAKKLMVSALSLRLRNPADPVDRPL